MSPVTPTLTTDAGTGASGGPAVVPASRTAGVHPARIDRQLGDHLLDPTYADARLEAMVKDAVDKARVQARAQGYVLGLAEGRRAADQEAKAQREEFARQEQQRQNEQQARASAVFQALAGAAAGLRQTEAGAWEAVADELTRGAAAIVEALLARELGEDTAAALEAARTALRTLGGAEPTVAVHPDDLVAVRDGLAEHAGAPTVVGDPALPRGAAVARRGDTQVLVDLPGVLARIVAELRG